MLPTDFFSLIQDGKLQEAVSLLEKHIADCPDDDNAYYTLGRVYWQMDCRADAVNCYRKALDLNPQSPARYALEIANDVFDFFNPDMFNP